MANCSIFSGIVHSSCYGIVYNMMQSCNGLRKRHWSPYIYALDGSANWTEAEMTNASKNSLHLIIIILPLNSCIICHRLKIVNWDISFISFVSWGGHWWDRRFVFFQSKYSLLTFSYIKLCDDLFLSFWKSGSQCMQCWWVAAENDTVAVGINHCK